MTMENEVVWEYWKMEADDSSTPWNIFRCFRYAEDYCPQLNALR